jgi:predicted NBD/HSP70 family sugar kinase
MRRINSVSTLRALHGAGPLTLAVIRARTGLSRSTVEGVLDDLVLQGQVEEIPADPATGQLGRPARQFRFRSETGYVLGLDIGAHHVQALIADLDGTVHARHREPTNRSAARAQRLTAARTAIRRCLAKARISRAQLQAAAAGTLGIVDDGVVTVCRVLPEWNDFDLHAQLRGWLDCPVVIENDINLSAIAERWRGAATDTEDMTWVSVGRSFAVGIVLGGQLFRGARGAAGEFGWIDELGWSEVLAHPLASLGGSDPAAARRAHRILDRARTGNRQESAAIDDFARLLTPGLAAIVLAYNPSTLIIGGAAAEAADVLLDRLTEHLGPRCLVMPRLQGSTLGDQATAIGAVRLALDRAHQRLFAIDETVVSMV